MSGVHIVILPLPLMTQKLKIKKFAFTCPKCSTDNIIDNRLQEPIQPEEPLAEQPIPAMEEPAFSADEAAQDEQFMGSAETSEQDVEPGKYYIETPVGGTESVSLTKNCRSLMNLSLLKSNHLKWMSQSQLKMSSLKSKKRCHLTSSLQK